jgi:hypothetical protein
MEVQGSALGSLMLKAIEEKGCLSQSSDSNSFTLKCELCPCAFSPLNWGKANVKELFQDVMNFCM